MMTREEAAARVIEECFWGDYRFDVTSLLAHIDENSDYFDRFLIDRRLQRSGDSAVGVEIHYRKTSMRQ
jgi:hypothetical protein